VTAGADDQDPANYCGYRHDLAELPFAERLRRRRDELTFSQEEFAALARVSRGTVRNAEGGKTIGASTQTALELAMGWRPSFPTSLARVPYQVLSAQAVSGVGGALIYEDFAKDEEQRQQNLADFSVLVAALAQDQPYTPPEFERVMQAARKLARPADVQALIRDMESAGLMWGRPVLPPGDLPGDQSGPPVGNAIYVPTPTEPPEQEVDREMVRRKLAILKDQAEWIRGYGQIWSSDLQGDDDRRETEASLLRGALPEEILPITRSGLPQRVQDGLIMYLSRRHSLHRQRIAAEIAELIRYLQQGEGEGSN
jgi:transcriptional regulator with XRE-family HTH domain